MYILILIVVLLHLCEIKFVKNYKNNLFRLQTYLFLERLYIGLTSLKLFLNFLGILYLIFENQYLFG